MGGRTMQHEAVSWAPTAACSPAAAFVGCAQPPSPAVIGVHWLLGVALLLAASAFVRWYAPSCRCRRRHSKLNAKSGLSVADAGLVRAGFQGAFGPGATTWVLARACAVLALLSEGARLVFVAATWSGDHALLAVAGNVTDADALPRPSVVPLTVALAAGMAAVNMIAQGLAVAALATDAARAALTMAAWHGSLRSRAESVVVHRQRFIRASRHGGAHAVVRALAEAGYPVLRGCSVAAVSAEGIMSLLIWSAAFGFVALVAGTSSVFEYARCSGALGLRGQADRPACLEPGAAPAVFPTTVMVMTMGTHLIFCWCFVLASARVMGRAIAAATVRAEKAVHAAADLSKRKAGLAVNALAVRASLLQISAKEQGIDLPAAAAATLALGELRAPIRPAAPAPSWASSERSEAGSSGHGDSLGRTELTLSTQEAAAIVARSVGEAWPLAGGPSQEPGRGRKAGDGTTVPAADNAPGVAPPSPAAGAGHEANDKGVPAAGTSPPRPAAEPPSPAHAAGPASDRSEAGSGAKAPPSPVAELDGPGAPVWSSHIARVGSLEPAGGVAPVAAGAPPAVMLAGLAPLVSVASSLGLASPPSLGTSGLGSVRSARAVRLSVDASGAPRKRGRVELARRTLAAWRASSSRLRRHLAVLTAACAVPATVAAIVAAVPGDLGIAAQAAVAVLRVAAVALLALAAVGRPGAKIAAELFGSSACAARCRRAGCRCDGPASGCCCRPGPRHGRSPPSPAGAGGSSSRGSSASAGGRLPHDAGVVATVPLRPVRHRPHPASAKPRKSAIRRAVPRLWRDDSVVMQELRLYLAGVEAAASPSGRPRPPGDVQ